MVETEDQKKRHAVNQYSTNWIVIAAVSFLILAVGFVRIVPRTCFYSSQDCCCVYEIMDRIDMVELHPLLQQIVKYPFFRYFKVKLRCDCPFWPDNGMCRLTDCSQCPENELPETFQMPSRNILSSDNLVCQEGKPQAAVDRTIDDKAFKGCLEVHNLWANDDETDHAELTYVNLQLNPERYTGYTGPSARRIWDAIYLENCQKYQYGECQENRILYKLISGLHSSVSIHIAADYLLDEETNTWGQNLSLLHDRVLKYPDRVRNLYFTFLFVLQSVTKAANYLEEVDYGTGEDVHAILLMKNLIYDHKLQAACLKPFDEAKLCKGQSGPELMKLIQTQLKNISAVIDCVGCEKCRLWGKLQILGLGTALKILSSVNDREISAHNLQLERNEVIALINLLNRLSESVKSVHELGPLAYRRFGKTIGGKGDRISYHIV